MKSTAFAIFLFLGFSAVAQPYINSVSPIVAGPNSLVTIAGSGFDSTATSNQVYLGAGKAQIISATTTVLTVIVPSTATSGPILVSNLTTDETATYRTNFIYSFGSTSSFNVTNFRTQDDIATNELQTYDICACDFDNDGDNDLVVTHNELPSDSDESTELLVYDNTSTTTATSFAGPTRLGTIPTIKVTCADLNSDGHQDIIATEGASIRNEIFIFQNQGTGTISTTFNSTADVTLEVPRDASNNVRNPEVVEVADMDGDGLIDIVIGNASNEEVDIFRNTTTDGGNITFSSSVFQITIPGVGSAVRGLALGDLNGDNYPEIVVTEISQENMFVLRNESNQGNLSFGDPVTIIVSNSEFRNVEIGDIDKDGFMDIAATDVRVGNTDGGNIVVIENATQNIGDVPSFNTPIVINSLRQAWGLAMGDIDGDGDLDIAVASESESNLDILVYNGDTTLTSGSFARNTFAVNFNTRNIGMADLNRDSKTDLYFTSNSTTGQTGFASVIVNQNCVKPSISPAGQTFCNGIEFLVRATDLDSATYSWEFDEGGGFGVDGASTTDTFDISTKTVDIKARVTLNQQGGCSVVSDEVNYSVGASSTATPTITTSPANACAGSSISLSTGATAANYFWEGPNLSTSVTSSTLELSSLTAANAGIYVLKTQDANSCLSAPDSIVIEVFSVPRVAVINENDDIFCEGGVANLRTQNIDGFNYQWQLNTSDITDSTGTTVTVSNSGSYRVQITDANSCSDVSNAISLTQVARPVASVSAEDEICVGIELAFTSLSTGSDTFSLSYSWDFLDSASTSVRTSMDSATTFSTDTAGLYFASLTAEYSSLAGCNDTAVDTFQVSAVPEVEIFTPDGIEKCPSDSLELLMPSGYSSYSWIDITSGSDTLTQYEDSNTAFATTANNADSATIQVIGVTPIQCTVISSVTIQNFFNSGFDITSQQSFETLGDTIIVPPMTNGVDLFAEGGSDFTWSPGDIFSDSAGTTVTVYPRLSNQVITITGTDINGCRESQLITIQNDNLTARNTFSPNGDGMGYECWEILNSSNITGCTVYIFDDRGRNVQVADSPFPNDCVWDGTANGTDVSVGLYYYVLKCQDSQLDQTGTILLAR